ncbi:penicillin-binding transpeptidase domain-containing protein [Arthrobacter sp. 35W]|uniref:penicillin-binding transpeptidase domain-containing protein n=1 Tax=Arthrobacter sp. 35W TaxID=1132441 RepID=UPI00042A2962|nr:penicillin-binding transpeptidase domain-containing protein [Arthrobacter sp. 35W]
MGKIKSLATALSVVVFAAALTGCDDGAAGARTAADSLATGLSTLNVDSIGFTDGEPQAKTAALAAATKGASGIKPTVDVESVAVKDNAGTANLEVAWPFGADSWKYSTTAHLERRDGAWHVAWRADLLLPGFADGDVLSVRRNTPKRGDILGDGGEVLVTNRPVVHVGIDKSHVDAATAPASAKALAALLELDSDAYAAQVAAAGPAAFVEALVMRDDASRTVTDGAVKAIPGGAALPGTLPLAPTRTFARPILGTVGEATAELVESSGGALGAGDETGLSGLQREYDKQLRGMDGAAVYKKAADGTTVPLFTSAPVGGTALATTLNAKLQTLAEDTLKDEASAAAIVAIRPSTGAVVAAASSPGSNGYNTALLGQYAPGSTFKVATSLAMLRKGSTPDSIVQCPAELNVDGKIFKNAGTYPAAHLGAIPLRDGFAHSCNTVFIGARDTVAQSDLASAASSLGLGVESPLGTAAFFGAVPTSATGPAHAAAMIGQGEVLVSPLAIATVAASVAKGSLVSPTLVALGAAKPSAAAPTGTAAASTAVAAGPALSAAEAAQLQDMMRAVVTSGHIGILADLPGAPVLAKTGTAEYGNDTPLKTHAWIIAAKGDLAVAVFVEDGGFGSVTGGPLMKAFLAGAGG